MPQISVVTNNSSRVLARKIRSKKRFGTNPEKKTTFIYENLEKGFLGDNTMAEQDNTLPILAHVLGILVGFIGPLIILLVAQDDNSRNHAKAALNWQLSAIIYFVVGLILTLILVGILVLIAVGVLTLVFAIIGAVRASRGELYKYPLSIPFFKID
jgi:uncharacterized Tic20 family protein